MRLCRSACATSALHSGQCAELTAHIVRIDKNTENETVCNASIRKGRLSICWFNKYLPKSNQLHMFRCSQHSAVANTATMTMIHSIPFPSHLIYFTLNNFVHSIKSFSLAFEVLIVANVGWSLLVIGGVVVLQLDWTASDFFHEYRSEKWTLIHRLNASFCRQSSVKLIFEHLILSQKTNLHSFLFSYFTWCGEGNFRII